MKKNYLLRNMSQMILLAGVVLVSACTALAQHQTLDQGLVEAVSKNDTATAIDLLKQGADANARDYSGRDAFSFARKRLFLDPPPKSTTPNATYPGPTGGISFEPVKWVSVLDIAVRANNVELVQALLDHKDDANSRTADGFPLLITAAERAKPEIVNILLQHGAQVNARDVDGGTPLLGAVTEGRWPVGPLRTGRMEIVNLLLAKGAKINLRDHFGETVLYYAVVNAHETGDFTVVKGLLKAGADPHLGDSSGDTPLIWTAQANAADLTELLLRSGAKVDARNRYGRTALMTWATSFPSSSTETGEILLKYGANVNARDRFRRTVLDQALSVPNSSGNDENYRAFIALLRKFGAKQSEEK
jgi:ankyrin repeat protein